MLGNISYIAYLIFNQRYTVIVIEVYLPFKPIKKCITFCKLFSSHTLAQYKSFINGIIIDCVFFFLEIRFVIYNRDYHSILLEKRFLLCRLESKLLLRPNDDGIVVLLRLNLFH